MGWWDGFYSFTSAIDDKLWYIKYQLEEWVQMLIDTAVWGLVAAYDILNHSWDEVKDYAVTAAAVGVDMVQDQVNDVRDLLYDKVDYLGNRIDSNKRTVMAALSSMESIAGSARAALENELTRAIEAARNEAESATRSIKNTMLSTMARMEREFDSGLTLLKTMLNASISSIAREAREARNILEGNLIYALDSVEDALEVAMSHLEENIQKALSVVGGRVDWLEGWVEHSKDWFDTEINKYKGRVIDWIVDGFEGILDRVFR